MVKISGRKTEQPRVSGSIAEFQSSSMFAYQRRGSATTDVVMVNVGWNADSCLIWNSGTSALLPPQKRQNVKKHCSTRRHSLVQHISLGTSFNFVDVTVNSSSLCSCCRFYSGPTRLLQTLFSLIHLICAHSLAVYSLSRLPSSTNIGLGTRKVAVDGDGLDATPK